MAPLFALIALLQTLSRCSFATGTITQPSVPSTITTRDLKDHSCQSGTEEWVDNDTTTHSSLYWTQHFLNSTTPSPTASHWNISSSTASDSANKSMTTSSWNQTIAVRPTSTVVVGAEGRLIFSPPSLDAAIGTIISFNFLGLNHTLTQSEFSNPCHANGGFDTGFRQFNPTNQSRAFVVEYEVTVSKPQWFFCAQTLRRSHCHAGMVFSLNPKGAQKQFLWNAVSAAATSATTPAPICHFPTFGIQTDGYGTSLTSSTRLATFNISKIGATPTTNFPIVSGAGANSVDAVLLALAYALFW